MRAVDIITKKRDKQNLTTAEINYFITGFTNGDIPDYQAAAWAMAVMLNGKPARRGNGAIDTSSALNERSIRGTDGVAVTSGVISQG